MNRRFRIIESSSNPVYKRCRKVLGGRGVRKHGATIAAGTRVVEEILRIDPGLCEAWLGTEEHSPPDGLPQDAACYRMAPALFRELDVFGTHDGLVLVRTPAMDTWDPSLGLPGSRCLMIPFQDPENVGAVIRSAAAFDVDAVIVLEEGAHPFHPKALRSSAGAVMAMRLFQGPALAELPPDLPVIPLSADGRDIETCELGVPAALLPGMEGPGLPEHFRSRAAAIRVSGTVESLNAAAATAIALYLWRRRAG